MTESAGDVRKSECAAELQAPCRAGVQKIDTKEGKAVHEDRGRGHSCREPRNDVEDDVQGAEDVRAACETMPSALTAVHSDAQGCTRRKR